MFGRDRAFLREFFCGSIHWSWPLLCNAMTSNLTVLSVLALAPPLPQPLPNFQTQLAGLRKGAYNAPGALPTDRSWGGESQRPPEVLQPGSPSYVQTGTNRCKGGTSPLGGSANLQPELGRYTRRPKSPAEAAHHQPPWLTFPKTASLTKPQIIGLFIYLV